MTVGVQSFYGERLTEAREARGILTMSSLADLLGVSKNAISLYESNQSKPRPQLVSQMAERMNVKESFFFLPPVKRPAYPVFQRSRTALSKHSRIIVERKFGWAKYLIDVYLKSYLDMPPVNLPSRQFLGIPGELNELSLNAIEEISLRCREFWGLGTHPIENVTELLESNGILVSSGLTESSELDAFSNISEYDGSLHIFLGLDRRSATRTRFDALHELGHLILHSHLPDHLVVDKKIHKQLETQAHRFAAAFLMPAVSFRRDVWMLSIEAFRTLKQEWKASVGAIIKRCDDLGYFGEDDHKIRRMWMKYRRDWETIERDELQVEVPDLMRRSIDMLLEAGIVSKRQILYDLPFSQFDIESLLGLPDGYLGESVINNPFPQIRSGPREGEHEENGKIIEFRKASNKK